MLKRTLFLLTTLLCASPAFAQRDAVDISTAVVVNSPPDVASWPITSKVDSMTETPESGPDPGFVMNFNARQRWPNYTPPGWDGPIQYTIWAGVKINGVWHISGFIQMWRERVATGAPILEYGPGCSVNNFACNWAYDGRWGAMMGYQPRAGEEMIFFATAGNARGVNTVTSVRERTNVVKIALPADDRGSWTFAADQTDLLIDTGATGIYTLLDAGIYGQIHPLNPKFIAAGDLDNNGFDEAVVDFGTQYGVWVKWNSSTWTQLHPYTTNGILVGNIDGNARKDVIIDFPGIGVWALLNGTTWAQIHGMNATKMAVTRDGTLVLNFPGYGVWGRRNNGVWAQLHPLQATALATGDFDNNNVQDVAMSFQGQGTWVFWGVGYWSKINNLDAQKIAVGDVDTYAADDLVIDFGTGSGVWALLNGNTWGPIHPLAAKSMALADLDGNGTDDMVIDFGTNWGIWILANLSSWMQASAATTDGFVAGRFN